MIPLTILVDADDVIENLSECWINRLNVQHGTSVRVDDVSDWDITLAFPILSKEQIFQPLREKALWNSLDPMPGCQKVLRELHDEGHDIYVVTASSYKGCEAKFDRILGMYPWLDWDHVIVTSNKQMIRGDVLIDDAPHNLVGGKYAKILFDRPHNRNFDNAAHGILRFRSWEEIGNAIRLFQHLYPNGGKQ